MVKVFISWSGPRAKAVALELKEWLPLVANCEPWMSDKDIDAGTAWGAEIQAELNETRFGIICVTSSNMDSAWLNFEAGALSKAVGDAATRVVPLLIGMTGPSELSSPLRVFQSVMPTEDGLRRLCQSINAQAEVQKTEAQIRQMVSANWPSLQAALDDIDEDEIVTDVVRRTDRDVLEEVLLAVREMRRGRDTAQPAPGQALSALLTGSGTLSVGGMLINSQKQALMRDLSQFVGLIDAWAGKGAHVELLNGEPGLSVPATWSQENITMIYDEMRRYINVPVQVRVRAPSENVDEDPSVAAHDATDA